MSNPSKSTGFFYDKVDFLSTLSHTYDEELPKHTNQRAQVENNNVAGDSDDDDFLPLESPDKAATALPINDAQPTGPASNLLKEYISLGYIDDAATNTPITQPPPPSPPAAVLDQVPWLDSIQTITSPFLRLHQEIVQFCRYLQPSPQESKARQEAVDRVAEIVKCIWPTADVEVFGSYATNIYLPTSDIDAVVLRSGCTNIPKGLKALANLFLRRKAARNIQVIAKARVPIIKFEEEVSGYAFDISFDVANGPEAADNVRNMMAEIPPMRPLVMILKVFLHQRDLNEVYQGGLGSYALLVLMAAHLLAHPSRRSTGGNNNNNNKRFQNYSSTASTDYAGEGNLGILLVDFFRLYGRALNPSVVGVSCRKGGGFFHKASTSGFNNPERSYLFAVEDPNDATNDLGRNSHNISRVRMAFDYAYCQLIAPSKQGTSLLKRIIRLDPVLFARDPSSHVIIEAREGGGGGEGVKKRRRE